MFKHGKITHEYGLSYARNIPYHTLKQMEQSVANVQKLFKKKHKWICEYCGRIEKCVKRPYCKPCCHIEKTNKKMIKIG